LKAKESGVGQESKQGKSVKQVDHLGIEGYAEDKEKGRTVR
jgi:hypothetical protein